MLCGIGVSVLVGVDNAGEVAEEVIVIALLGRGVSVSDESGTGIVEDTDPS